MNLQKKFINYYYLVCLNGLLAVFLGIGYFFSRGCNPRQFFFIPQDTVTLTFLTSAHFSSVMLLTLLVGLLISPFMLLPSKIYKHIITIIWTTCIAWFFLDIVSNYFFSVGINTTLTMLHFFNFPARYSTECKIVLLILFIALYLWQYNSLKKLEQPLITKKNKILALLIIVTLFLSIIAHSIFYLVLDKNKQQFIASSQFLPWFYQTNEFMQKIPSVNQNTIIENTKNALIGKQPEVNYPLKPLVTEKIIQPPNIVMIVIDCWRADFFNATDTPKLWKFAQSGKIFYNHQSSGNCTKFGLFGLFYAIPATHMNEFKRTEQTPIFIDRLQQLNYQMSAFNWWGEWDDQVNVYYFLHKTPAILYHTRGDSPAEFDKNITEDWLSWHEKVNKNQAYFSLIVYGSVYGNDFDPKYTNTYPPTKGKYRYNDLAEQLGSDAFIETYKTAVNYVDDLASLIISRLKDSGDLENTIVIITGDHGQEFAENSQAFWGHGTNFTNSQTKTPFAVVGPKFTNNNLAMQQQDLTSHYDIAPTIMKNFLGVNNNINDYSIGIDLLDKRIQRNWSIMVGNFKWCGIVNKDFITYCHASGNYCSTTKKNHPLFNQSVNQPDLTEALNQMFKFLH